MRFAKRTVLIMVLAATSICRAEPPPQSTSDGEKSYVIPAVEIVTFEFGLNQFDRHFASDRQDYRSGPGTFWTNLHRRWEFDKDPFDINQIGHPYAGATYYRFARSTGLSFWESAGYATLGSALWETAGETVPPSINDQVTTSVGGSFLGEALFRIGALVRGDSPDSTVREVGAAVLSTPTAINHLLFGNRFDYRLQTTRPAYSARLGAGAVWNAHVSQSPDWDSADTTVASGEFNLAYGLPGKPGYRYDQPFDYFDFEATVTSSSQDPLQELFVRGLLYGSDYASGGDFRGIFGLYGGYDYLSAEIFRAASSYFSFGTTGQWRVAPAIVLQGTALGGAGFGAGGTIADTSGNRDNHYGVVPQGLLDLRLICGSRFMIGASGRNYYIFGSGSEGISARDEDIAHEKAAILWRIYGPHALELRYTGSQRRASFKNIPDRRQNSDAFGLYYNYLFDENLGAVGW